MKLISIISLLNKEVPYKHKSQNNLWSFKVWTNSINMMYSEVKFTEVTPYELKLLGVLVR